MPNTKNEQGKDDYAIRIFGAFIPPFADLLKTKKYILPPRTSSLTLSRVKQSLSNLLNRRSSKKHLFFNKFFDRLDTLMLDSHLDFQEKVRAIRLIEADLNKHIFPTARYSKGYPEDVGYYMDLLALMRAMFHLRNATDTKQGEEEAWKEFFHCVEKFTQRSYKFPEENLQKTILPWLHSFYCSLFPEEDAFLKTKPITLIKHLLSLNMQTFTLWVNHRNLHNFKQRLQYTALFEPYHTMSLQPVLEKIEEGVKDFFQSSLSIEACHSSLVEISKLFEQIESKFRIKQTGTDIKNILEFPQIASCVNRVKATIEFAKLISEIKCSKGMPHFLTKKGLQAEAKSLLETFCQTVLNNDNYAKSLLNKIPQGFCKWQAKHKASNKITSQMLSFICSFQKQCEKSTVKSVNPGRLSVTAYDSDSDCSTITVSDTAKEESSLKNSSRRSSLSEAKQKPEIVLKSVKKQTLQAYLDDKYRIASLQIVALVDQELALTERGYQIEAEALRKLKKFIEAKVRDFFANQASELTNRKTEADVTMFIEQFEKAFVDEVEKPIKNEMNEATYFRGDYQQFKTRIQDRDRKAGKKVKENMTLTEHRDPKAKRIIKQFFANVLLLLGTLVVGYFAACMVNRGFFFTKTKTQSVLDKTLSVIGTAEKQTKGLREIHNRVYW